MGRQLKRRETLNVFRANWVRAEVTRFQSLRGRGKQPERWGGHIMLKQEQQNSESQRLGLSFASRLSLVFPQHANRYLKSARTCFAEVLRLGSNVSSLDMRSIASEVRSLSVPAVLAVSVCHKYLAMRKRKTIWMMRHGDSTVLCGFFRYQQASSEPNRHAWQLQKMA